MSTSLFSLTAAIHSTSQPVAGCGFSFIATTTGTWTNGYSRTSPITISGISGAYITAQYVSGTNTAFVVVYAGNVAGTLTITDTVNGGTTSITVSAVRALRTTSGTKRYVQGGIRNVPAPRALITGSPGTQTCHYQIIGHDAAGTTCGSVLQSCTAQNIPSTGSANYFYSQRATSVYSAPTTLTTTNYITLTWPAIPGATAYDVLRSSDGISWVSLALNQTATSNPTYVDNGTATTASYTLPTTNSTATGNDGHSGTSAAPFATLAQAASFSVAGNEIHVSGFVTDANPVMIPAGVNLTGDDRTTSVLFSTYNGIAQRACYGLPSGADVSDLSFENEQQVQQLLGYGAQGTDPLITDVNVYRCDVRGFTKAFTTNSIVLGHGFTFIDCSFNSVHGCFGLVSPGGGVTLTQYSVANLIRCRSSAVGAVLLSGALSIPLQVSEGFIFMRDCNTFSNLDSQDSIGWRSCGGYFAPSNQNQCGLILINTLLYGRTADLNFNPTSAGYFSLWQMGNSPIDPAKNAAIFSTITPIAISPNTYMADPTIATPSNGGSNTPAVVSLGLGL